MKYLLGLHNEEVISTQFQYCMAIRDDYEWWDANHESGESGKVLLVDAEQVQALSLALQQGVPFPVANGDIIQVQ